MEETFHSMTNLFAPLSLSSTPDDIRRFINAHCPLPEPIALHKAPFWSPAQATFFQENIRNDADRGEAVDQPSAALQKSNK
jgi:Protein of unknown function (DUF2789)